MAISLSQTAVVSAHWASNDACQGRCPQVGALHVTRGDSFVRPISPAASPLSDRG